MKMACGEKFHCACAQEKLVHGVMWEAEFLEYLCSFIRPGR